MNREPKTIVVGMSGGVDSSVCARLLQQQGHKVIGLFMKNWEDGGEDCPAEKDFKDVQKVCEAWSIPYYSVNFAKEYRERVFDKFLRDIEKGLTPNPDILCNSEIKFDVFYDYAHELGADLIATGHYCRTDGVHLLKGKDLGKDQSYFLHGINPRVLKNVIFPLGELQKPEVRSLATQWNLATAEKKDSMGICFIGEKKFRPFLKRYIDSSIGSFKNLNGEVLGEHEGHVFYTIGQRKGLGLGGQGAPWFVVAKDPLTNTVFVERGEEHQALYARAGVVSEMNWLIPPPEKEFKAQAKIRYRQADQQCRVKITDHSVLIEFDEFQRALTPQQSIVLYRGDICLGGGPLLRPLDPKLPIMNSHYSYPEGPLSSLRV